MPQLGLDGQKTMDPMTFIVSIAEFVPSFFSILYWVCILIGLLMVGNGFLRQVKTSQGRNDFTFGANLGHMFFGGGLAVIGYMIGGLGKGVFGAEYKDASALLYVAQTQDNLARTAMAAFLVVLQFIGAVACVVGYKQANRLAVGPAKPSDSWPGVFWYCFGGLALMFIQYSFGILSAITGMNLSGMINSL